MSHLVDRDYLSSGLPTLSNRRRFDCIGAGVSHISPRRIIDVGNLPASPRLDALRIQNTSERERFLQRELDRKEKLMQELIATNRAKSATMHGHSLYGSGVPDYMQRTDGTRSELAAQQVRNSSLQAENAQLCARLQTAEQQLNDLRIQLEVERENAARHLASYEALRQQLTVTDEKIAFLESEKSQSTYQLQNLTTLEKEHKDCLFDLETRLQEKVRGMELEASKADTWQRKFQEFLAKVGHALNIDTGAGTYPDVDISVMSKLTDAIEDKRSCEAKLNSIMDALKSSELESKANRETIMRLVHDVNREQHTSTTTTGAVEMLRVERDEAMRKRMDLEREVDMLRQRLEMNQKSWTSSRMEMEERERYGANVNNDMRNMQFQARSTMQQYDAFRQSLATLLSENFRYTGRSDEAVKASVRDLCIAAKTEKSTIISLEDRLTRTSAELENLRLTAAVSRTSTLDLTSHLADRETRLRNIEGDLATTEVLREQLIRERQENMRLMEKLSRVMKLDAIATDIGFDMTGDALLSRAEQLSKLEGDSLADRTTHIYSLQRKMKVMKEKLESKDLHINLLRKKIIALEERLSGKSGVEYERDEGEMSRRRLVKENDRLRREVTEARSMIISLKGDLSELKSIKISEYEKESMIHDLRRSMGSLEKIKSKQAKKLATMRNELEYTEHEAARGLTHSESTLNALSNELRSVKRALDEISRREKQLVDFRNVVARMLGLEIAILAIPDYEIVSRLEKLIQSHHRHVAMTTGVVEDKYWNGYESAKDKLRSARGRTRSLSSDRFRYRMH